MRISTSILIVFAAALALAVACLPANAEVWQPTPGYTQLPIWPGAAPDPRPDTKPEGTKPRPGFAGAKPWLEVNNVAVPTMTVYAPKGRNTRAAVVVFPGGGYQVLAIDLEGTEICDWLTSRGITCVLLKYRVPFSGPSWDVEKKRRVIPEVPTALQDAQRTIGLVRFHAAEWNIDPHKVGVIGFSAGGHVVAGVSTNFERRAYPNVDAADKESSRPDFALVLYPGHLWGNGDHGYTRGKETFELKSDLPVSAQTPPTFLLQATNDPIDDVNESLTYYIALRDAGVPVEMHLYAEGGHGFGLRPAKFPITKWPLLAEKWLASIGMVEEAP
jgi:acetyl esterase/lipase